MRVYTVIMATLLLASCSNRIYLHRINVFLNADNGETRGEYLADDYHSFFAERKGHGKNKSEALHSFANWDAPLHPDIHILHYSISGNEWQVWFLEKNDFTKLINFPGWNGKELITFNDKKQITSMVYVPDDQSPNYKRWLQPAIDWLQKNQPAQLHEVYRENKLVQNPETAKKWVELLKLWQKEK